MTLSGAPSGPARAGNRGRGAFGRPRGPKVGAPHRLPPVSVHQAPARLRAGPGGCACAPSAGSAIPTFQLVFGVQDAADPVIPVLRRILTSFAGPGQCTLVIDPTPHGINPKVANLVNMLPQARHDILVVADSDMRVREDYLARVVETLQMPTGSGLVTTLYSRPADGARPGRPARLRPESPTASLPGRPARPRARSAGLFRCHHGPAARGARPASAASARASPACLADDAALGREVKSGSACKVANWPAPCRAPSVAETKACKALIAHELRWDRTMRSVAPVWALPCRRSSTRSPGRCSPFCSRGPSAIWAWVLLALGLDRCAALVAVAIDRALGRARAQPVLAPALCPRRALAGPCRSRAFWVTGWTGRAKPCASIAGRTFSLRGSQGR